MTAQIVFSESSPTSAFIVPHEEPHVVEGQILVHVSKIIVTANTVTYSIAGRAPVLNYFDTFPLEDPDYASCPVWGFGVVAQSKCKHVPVGQRLFGYFSFRPSVVLTPGPVNEKSRSFEDLAPNRQPMPQPYRSYRLQPALVPSSGGGGDGGGGSGKEMDDMENFNAAGPLLFSTGWGCAQQALARGANAMLLTSASSRTSMGAAFSARHHNLFSTVIGVTSERNVEFCQASGLYDIVATYESLAKEEEEKEEEGKGGGALGALPLSTKLGIYDMAGNTAANKRLRERFGAAVVDFGRVGQTDVASSGSGLARELPITAKGGAKPRSFLVFTALGEAAQKYGATEMQQMLAGAQEAYCRAMLPGFVCERAYGAEATLRVWERTVKNEAKPGVTYVCSLWDDATRAEPQFGGAGGAGSAGSGPARATTTAKL